MFAFGEHVVATRNAVMVPAQTARIEVGAWSVPARSRAELQLEEALCD